MGISIRSPTSKIAPNIDGIDPQSCRNVRIANCFLDTGDDCITLKSGEGETGRRVGKPTENVTITNCVMYNGHGAVVIGSEMSGGVRNVVASNIVCRGTLAGVRIKTQRGRGGVVENIRFNNWVIEEVPAPITISQHYFTNIYAKAAPEPVSERTPILRNIAISNFTINNSPRVAEVLGLPEMPIQGLRISDIIASATQGLQCDSVDGLELSKIRVNVKEGNAFNISNCRRVELDGVQSSEPIAGRAVVRLDNVADAFIHGCWPSAGTETFLEILGEGSKGISLLGNNLSAVGKTIAFGEGAYADAVVDGSVGGIMQQSLHK